MEPTYLIINHTVSYNWNGGTNTALQEIKLSKDGPAFLLTKDDRQRLISIKNDSSSNKLQDNTKIHVTKFSTLPKYKLDNYIEENKLKINRCRINKSPDSIVVNFDNLEKEYFKYSKKCYLIPGKLLFSLIDINEFKESHEHGENYYFKPTQEIYANLENYTYLYYGYDLDRLKQVNYTLFKEISNCETITGWVITESWGNKIGYENIDLLHDILNYKYNIICDSSISKDINSGTVIDPDLFKTLLGMASSTDNSNLAIVREIIANSEMEASKPYILFLLWWNEPLRKIDNNANYKFCLNQLKEFKNYYDSSRLDYFLQNVIVRLPEHKQIFFDCLAMYINHTAKYDLIKQLIVS